MLTKEKGFSIVELLITIGLAAILFPALLTGFVATRGGRAQGDQRIGAIALAQETQEEIRVIRESGWDFLPLENNYYPKVSGFSWVLASLPEVPPRTDGFTRVVNISKVFRDDVSKKIVDTGGIEDPSTKKITTTVSWGNPIPYTVTNIQYLTRNANEGYVETTQTDFNNAGATKTHVVVQPTLGTSIADDGEIILGPGGGADWCNPAANLVEFDLPKNGVALAVSAEVGRVFVGTGENSSGVSLADVDTTDPNNPKLPPGNTVDGYKTNAVFVDGNFGYVATDTNSKEVAIIDLNSHTEIGYFNAPGNGNGNSVYAANDIGYVTVGNKLYNFDLSIKNGSRPGKDLDGVTLDGTGNKVMVIGDYAYVAIDSASNQLDIIDIHTPDNMTIVGRATVSGGAGRDVFVNSSGTRAYLVTANSSGKEFFIINIETKTGNSHDLVGSYEAGGLDPTGVTVIEADKRAIIVGKQWSGEEYQVLKLEDEKNPISCPGLNFNFGINGVSSVWQATTAYSYIVTPDSGKELKIIKGGTGGGGGKYASQGTYESQTIDILKDVVFNSFTASTQTSPPTTDLSYQIAIKPGSGGDCSTVTFNNSDFITRTPGAFPFGTTGQCLRFRAILSSSPDYSQTPILSDITFNYSK